MALDLGQIFVSVQYLEFKLMDFDQILYMHWYWDLFHIVFCKFIAELWSLIDARISFLLNILKMKEWILTKFCICIDIDKILVGIVTCQQNYVPWLMS